MLPRITIVTPSLNQGEFIEETIRSILLQGYPDLEYFVIDGGSTDDTIEILKAYSPWISAWVSERDGGQSAAINRGLRMGSGSYATWINSDDMLCQDALANVTPTLDSPGSVLYVGDCVNIDVEGRTLFLHRSRVSCFEELVRISSIWRRGGYICQPEVLFPLALALAVGALDERNHLTMDYEFWGRLFLAGATVRHTQIPFGIFRHHPSQKTIQQCVAQTESMIADAESLLHASDLRADVRRELLADLERYRRAYPTEHWRQSGRLARLGLPPAVVRPIRQLRRIVEQRISSLLSSP